MDQIESFILDILDTDLCNNIELVCNRLFLIKYKDDIIHEFIIKNNLVQIVLNFDGSPYNHISHIIINNYSIYYYHDFDNNGKVFCNMEIRKNVDGKPLYIKNISDEIFGYLYRPVSLCLSDLIRNTSKSANKK